MPRKLVPGDWCRVNDKVRKLMRKMFNIADSDFPSSGPESFIFVKINNVKGESRTLSINAQYGQSRWENWNYPRAALTFLFHEKEAGHD